MCQEAFVRELMLGKGANVSIKRRGDAPGRPCYIIRTHGKLSKVKESVNDLTKNLAQSGLKQELNPDCAFSLDLVNYLSILQNINAPD